MPITQLSNHLGRAHFLSISLSLSFSLFRYSASHLLGPLLTILIRRNSIHVYKLNKKKLKSSACIFFHNYGITKITSVNVYVYIKYQHKRKFDSLVTKNSKKKKTKKPIKWTPAQPTRITTNKNVIYFI